MAEPTSLELVLSPAQAADPEQIRAECARRLGCGVDRLVAVVPKRRSLDARRGHPQVLLSVDVYRHQTPTPEPLLLPRLKPARGDPVLIVGAGPAGYFAALELLFLGVRPIVLERGQDTRTRRYDLRAIMQEGRVNPHSNYCFGEGGAGTYSDGKLYTRATKRGDVRRVLRLLVECGARSDILVEAHPHIGSNRLPGIIERLRATLLEYGGEVRFGHHVTALIVRDERVFGVEVADHGSLLGQAVILSTGHSARDVFHMLRGQGLSLEAKPFAVGVRVEHPQALIDEIQYRQRPRDPHLPAASYSLTCQAEGRGAYSFCMCPGGLMVPAATAPGEVVLNGMSMSGRNSRYANSGLVTEVGEADLTAFAAAGPLAGLEFQSQLERACFAAVPGLHQTAPAQRLEDFLAGTVSADLPRSSYVPGLHSHPLHELLPGFVVDVLRKALVTFDRRLRGYRTREAVLVATESRTSSPVRVPRDREGLFHPQLPNLYPCGEGAGYAGGIVSAALDGQRVAQAVARALG